jgi:UDP-N-acetylmuramoyl-L-alanyl-D-glutamate--2,6-diaminopimelate ligase
MGKALADGADVCIFTSDNPRSEDPDKILNQMVEGVSYSDPSKLIADRRDAIAYAVSLAQSGDCVLILGKGHEKGQEIKGTIHPFDDRLVLAEEIEAKR